MKMERLSTLILFAIFLALTTSTLAADTCPPGSSITTTAHWTSVINGETFYSWEGYCVCTTTPARFTPTQTAKPVLDITISCPPGYSTTITTAVWTSIIGGETVTGWDGYCPGAS